MNDDNERYERLLYDTWLLIAAREGRLAYGHHEEDGRLSFFVFNREDAPVSILTPGAEKVTGLIELGFLTRVLGWEGRLDLTEAGQREIEDAEIVREMERRRPGGRVRPDDFSDGSGG